jgi:hypothetical protein
MQWEKTLLSHPPPGRALGAGEPIGLALGNDTIDHGRASISSGASLLSGGFVSAQELSAIHDRLAALESKLADLSDEVVALRERVADKDVSAELYPAPPDHGPARAERAQYPRRR